MKTRIITAIFALIVFLPILFLGGHYFFFTTAFLSALAVYEIVKITFKEFNLLLFILLTLLIQSFFFVNLLQPNYYNLLIFVIVFCLFLTIIFSNHKIKIVDISTAIFLTLYIGVGFFALYNIRLMSLELVFYLLLTIWITDSGAYFGGMKFGKRKLSPNISPNKSIEGSIIGSCSSIIIALIFFFTTTIFNNIFEAILVTLVISVVGQIGDLIESAYKREYGVKDSSNLLPGHGGIFDRFDSVILSAPVLLLFLEIIKM